MYTLVISVLIIVCILLALVVLIQSGKGGGLAANFASANQIMGVRQTTDTIEKITWAGGTLLFLLALVGTFSIPSNTAQNTVRESKLKGKLENVTTTVPNAQQIPAAQQQQGQPAQQQAQPAQQQPAQGQPAQQNP